MTASTSPATASDKPRSLAGVELLAVAAGLLLAFWPLLTYDPYAKAAAIRYEGADEFFFTSSGGSPLIIFGVALSMLYTRSRLIRDALGRPALYSAAIPLLAVGVALRIWAHYVDAVDLTLLAFVLVVLGSAALLGGRAGLRAVWLPAVFTLLLFPLPVAWINALIYELQLANSELAAWILNRVGIDALYSADRIFARDHVFQVIESCTGLRSIDTLFMSAVIYADLFYRGRRQVVLLLLLSTPLAMVTNQIRILSLVLNPFSHFASIHTLQGIFMLVVGVLLIAGLDHLIARFVPERGDPAARFARAGDSWAGSRGSARGRAAGLCGLLVVLGVGTLGVAAYEPPAQRWPGIYRFPSSVDGWQSTSLDMDETFLGSVRFKDWVHRSYRKDDALVELFMGDGDRGNRRTSVLSDKTLVPGSGWGIVTRGDSGLELEGVEVESAVVQMGPSYALVYHWLVGTESVATETLRALSAVDQSPWRRPGRPLVVRLATPLDTRPDALARASARLNEFARSTQRELESIYGPTVAH